MPSENEILIMRRCIGLAKLSFGNTYPNPMVGSILIKDKKIVGEGYHHKAGTPHAEVNAIANTQENLLPQSHIFVTLEPCSHFGKTPPCASLIAQKKIPKVTVGIKDTHQKVNGKGIEKLQKEGIDISYSSLQKECLSLNKRFFTFHKKNRPFILLKWAESADGFIDKDGKQTSISNRLVKQFVHTIRSQEHAILVGKNTAINDNPTLTTREIVGRNPIRIIMDKNLEIPAKYNVMDNTVETIIINEIKESKEKNIVYAKVEDIKNWRLVLEKLHRLSIQSVLIEGGSKILKTCIEQGLWDEAIIIKNENLTLQKGTVAPEITIKPTAHKIFRDNEVYFYINPNSIL